MSSILPIFIFSCAAFVVRVAAQQGAYAQCGGTGWTGSTTCVSGYYCSKANDYYSQCVPGTASTTPAKPTTTSSASGPVATGVKYWFSFGDSYTGTGFNITGAKPTTGNQLGNPGYPGYTACGLGNNSCAPVPNWVDLVTVKYNPGTLLTYNFAYGGATIDANLVKPYTPTVQSLTDQVNTFLLNKSVAPWTASNTLFSTFIGINDLSSSWFQSGDRDAFSDTLLNAYFALVQKLYDAGGRDFLFVNVPPIDRAPVLAGQPYAQTTLKSVIDHFNTKLATRVSLFASSHSGVKTWIYDSNSELNKLLNSPATYGFQDGTSYGDGANLMWCNDLHVSSGVHSYFGQDVATLLKGSFTRRSN